MNRFFLRLLFAVFLAVLQPAESMAQTQPSQADVDELRSLMQNTSYQFVYAFFGKDLLVAYADSDKAREVLKKASDSDLSHFAKPFNANIGGFVVLGLQVVYGLTVAYFFIKLIFFLKENIWYAQRKGTMTISAQAARGILLRVVFFGGAALTPWAVTTQFSTDSKFIGASHVLFMNFLGMAHNVADESFQELIKKTRPSSHSIRIPRADNKMGIGMAINQFYACTRLDSGRIGAQAGLAVDFRKTPAGDLHAVLSEGRCHLSLQASEDPGMIAAAKAVKALNPNLSVDPEALASSQRAVISKVFSDAFNMALASSERLVLPSLPSEEVSAENQSSQFKTREWTSAVRTDTQLANWSDGCASLQQLSLGDAITDRDRVLFHLLSARCLSKEVSATMLYPASIASVEKFLDSGPLKNRELPLCVESAAMAQLRDARFTPAFGVSDDTDEALQARETVGLEQCVLKQCSDAAMKSGGMYVCANALAALERRSQDLKAGERGIMAAGLYMFQMFTHQSPGDSAKRMYRTINAEFSREAFPASSGDAVFSLQVPLPPLDVNHGDKWDDVMDTLDAAPTHEDSVLIDPIVKHEHWLDDMTQHSRLMTCVKSPMQVSGGYVCGNVPQEFNRFGMNLLRAAIAAKTLLVVGDAARRVGQQKAESGTIGKTLVTSSVAKLSAWLGASLYADMVMDGVLSAGFSMTDEFGYWDQTQTREWLSYSNVLTAALALGLSSHASAIQLIDTALFFGLLLGVVFAFLIPVFPLLLVLSALGKLTVLLFVNSVMSGFRLVNCAFERDNDQFLGSEFDQLWSDWVATLLKLPLTIVGLGLAWLMSNVIIAHVVRRMNVTLVTNDGQNGFLDTIVVMIVSMIIVYVVYNMVITVIESFYDFTVEWILGQLTNNPYGDRRGIGLKESSEVLNIMAGR